MSLDWVDARVVPPPENVRILVKLYAKHGYREDDYLTYWAISGTFDGQLFYMDYNDTPIDISVDGVYNHDTYTHWKLLGDL